MSESLGIIGNAAGDKVHFTKKLRRPDVIQTSAVLQDIQRKTGKSWQECGAELVAEFQKGSATESKQLSPLESAIVALLPHLTPETKAPFSC